MKIRYCQKEDLEAIYKLICELEECNLNHEQFALVYENKLNDEKSHYLVAVSDDMIVGFVVLISIINYIMRIKLQQSKN